MKSLKTTLLALMLLSIALPAAAQTDVDLDPEVGARISATIDKKLSRGLHISFEEEVRFDNNFGSFDRLQHTLHASYKVHTNVKVGLGYALINGYSSTNSAFKGARHRLMGDAAYTWHLSQWNLSIKERLQYTLRIGDYNTYQNPAGILGLKSRLSAKYKGWQHRGWTPYAYLELRTNFSGPSITADYNVATGTYFVPGTSDIEGEAGWFLDGFSSTYNDRLRLCFGTDYRITRASTLTAYLLADYLNEKVVDANKEGTKLKSYTHERGLMFSLGVAYQYAF